MPPSSKLRRLHELYYVRCPLPTPVAVAMQMGWIQDAMQHLAGVNVRPLFESVNPADWPRHFQVDHPNAFRQAGSMPAIWGRSDNRDTRVIGLTWTDEFQALIALPHSGVRDVKDLRGRRIGLPRHDVVVDHFRASALRAFSVMLESEGLSLNDVELVDLPDHEIPSIVCDDTVIATGNGRRGRYAYGSEMHALSHELVDAVYVKDMRGAQTVHLLGAHIVADINSHPDPFIRTNTCSPRPLTVNAWLLEYYPHVVDCLLAQVSRAGEWAESHPAETLRALGREMGWSEGWVSYAYGDAVHRNLRLDLNGENIERLALLKNFMLEHQFIQNDFDVHEWVDPLPMQRLIQRRKQKSSWSTPEPWSYVSSGLVH